VRMRKTAVARVESVENLNPWYIDSGKSGVDTDSIS